MANQVVTNPYAHDALLIALKGSPDNEANKHWLEALRRDLQNPEAYLLAAQYRKLFTDVGQEWFKYRREPTIDLPDTLPLLNWIQFLQKQETEGGNVHTTMTEGQSIAYHELQAKDVASLLRTPADLWSELREQARNAERRAYLLAIELPQTFVRFRPTYLEVFAFCHYLKAKPQYASGS